jgi:ParB family chromosome partitioning protein
MLFQKTQNAEQVINRVLQIPIASIKPNPNQPRVIFDDYELSQLAVSIRQNGILQPITVRKSGDAGYEIISGERRLRAAKLINLEYVPCIVIDTSSENSAVLAILENIQRSDLNYIEEALSIRSLIEHFGITQEDCAAKLGIAQSTVANKLRLLRLTDEEKAFVLRYKLNERQARALLRLPSDARLGVIEKIAAEQLNTSQTDKLIDEILNRSQTQDTQKKPKHSWDFRQARLYINSINKMIDSMKRAGIDCTSSQSENNGFIEYLFRVKID